MTSRIASRSINISSVAALACISNILSEFGGALFAERGNALAVIGGANALRFPRNALFHHRLGDTFQLHVRQHLGPADRLLRARQKLVAKGINGGVQQARNG
jgi:hypothetical protein